MKTSSSIRNLVAGGAGFFWYDLVDRLMKSLEKAICLDDFFTGRIENMAYLILDGHKSSQFIYHDVIEPIKLQAFFLW